MRTGTAKLIAIPICLLAGHGIGQAVDLQDVLQRPQVRSGLEHIDDRRQETAELLARLGAIVSPSGAEHERAAAVADAMRAAGLQDVRVTDSPNAIGIIPGRSERALVFLSTLDDLATVAGHQRATAVPPTVAGDRVVGPGTNTSVTSAALLAAAGALSAQGITPEVTLVFAAVAQEETGLRGMKALYEEYRDRADAFIDVLGDGHSISFGAIGIHWWRVIATGPGGHTLSGGLPNVNQGIGRAVDRILSLSDATRNDDTRTRINISVLQSGSVFNHKPVSGWFSLDIRSMDAEIIAAIEAQVREVLAGVAEQTGIELAMEPFQLTPGGQVPGADRSALVLTAREISRYLGYEPRLSNSGSSNMNVAIAAGTLAIGLGGSRGGERGQPTEWADIDGMIRTAKHVFLLAASLGMSQDRAPTGSTDYDLVEGWLKPFAAEGFAFGGNSGVHAESPDRILLLQRGETRLPDPVPDGFSGFAGSIGINVLGGVGRTWQNIVFVVDRDGNVVDVWDRWDHLFEGSRGPGPHRLRVSPYDPERRVWVVHESGHQIFVFSNDGSELLITLGEKNVAASDETHFGQPQDVAFLPDGRVLVADGLRNKRVVILDAEGRYQSEFGGPGDELGQFASVHALAFGPDDRLFVADRDNRRVQVFRHTEGAAGSYHPEFTPVAEWTGFNLTLDIIVNEDCVWVSDVGPPRITQLDFDGNRLHEWYLPTEGPARFLEVHSFAVDSAGNLYGSDNQHGRTQKFVPRADADPERLIRMPYVRR